MKLAAMGRVPSDNRWAKLNLDAPLSDDGSATAARWNEFVRCVQP